STCFSKSVAISSSLGCARRSTSPAATRTFFWRSRSTLAAWRSASVTGAPETSAAQTTQPEARKPIVYALLWATAREPPPDVGPHEIMVDERREDVHEEDGEHHPLRVRGVHHADEHRERADAEAVEPLARAREGRAHRIGRHEDRAERPAAEHQMPGARHGEEGVGRGADRAEEPREGRRAEEHAEHRPVRRDAGHHQEEAAEQAEEGRGLAHRARHEPEERVREV